MKEFFFNTRSWTDEIIPHDLSSSFYKLLKTLLFGRAWAGNASE